MKKKVVFFSQKTVARALKLAVTVLSHFYGAPKKGRGHMADARKKDLGL